jgi:hypothetical protein
MDRAGGGVSPHLSRHVDNDDMRHFAFERNSRIPYGSFDSTPEWMTRKSMRWTAIALLVVALVALIAVRADVSDEEIFAAPATQARR